jgi:membrane protein YdbS with pleckstrin-like domain
MSELHFDCPHCGRRILGDEGSCGTTVVCPACRNDVILPPLPDPNRPPAKVARLILDTAEEQPAAAPAGDKEYDVWNARPAARAFSGRIVLGILLAPVIVGLVLLASVWWRIRSSRYRLTTQRLFVQRGLFMKQTNEMELYRVKDVRVDQGLVQRLLGVGSITVLSSDDSTPAVTLLGVDRPQDVKETIRTHYRAARKREGVRSSEIIPSW